MAVDMDDGRSTPAILVKQSDLVSEKETGPGIYLIFGSKSGKGYVGSSSCIIERVNKHTKCLLGNRHINAHLQSSVNLYGFCTFSAHVLQRIDGANEADLIANEGLWWDKCHPDRWFNAGRPKSGIPETPEVKTKRSAAISAAWKDAEISERWGRAISKAWGNPELKARASARMKEGNATPQAKINRSVGHRGNNSTLTEQDIICIRREIKEARNGRLVALPGSWDKIAEKYDISRSSLHNIVCNLTWKWVKE